MSDVPIVRTCVCVFEESCSVAFACSKILILWWPALCGSSVSTSLIGQNLVANTHFYCTATVFSYLLHETNTLLFLVAGGTGYLESVGHLPRDSIRAALVLAFGGTAFLWHMHAVSRSDDTTVWVHEAISWLATGTAITMLISVLASKRQGIPVDELPRGRSGFSGHASSVASDGGQYPLLFFFLYVASFVLIVWMGTWFITAGQHSSSPLALDRVPCYFVLQGVLQFVLVQAFLIFLLRRYQPNRDYGLLRRRRSSVVRRVREQSPARVELELHGA